MNKVTLELTILLPGFADKDAVRTLHWTQLTTEC